jgi:hypothetical protein
VVDSSVGDLAVFRRRCVPFAKREIRFLQFVAKRLVFLPYGAQQDHVIWLNDINPSWVAHLELIHYSRMVVEFPVIIT